MVQMDMRARARVGLSVYTKFCTPSLAKNGTLEVVANCSGRGWKLSNGICWPLPYTEDQQQRVRGWQALKSSEDVPTRKLKISWWDYLTKKFA